MLGCLEALRRSGIGSKYAFAHLGEPADVNFVRRVLDCSNPNAVICSNDQTAALLIRSLAQLKKHVPVQIAVAGFDDVQYAMLLSPQLPHNPPTMPRNRPIRR